MNPAKQMELRTPKVPSSYRTAYLLIYLPGVLRISIHSQADGNPEHAEDSENDESSPEIERNSLDCDKPDGDSTDDSTTERSVVVPETSDIRPEESSIGDSDLSVSPQLASLDNWLRGWMIRRQITLKAFSGETGAADYSVRKE